MSLHSTSPDQDPTAGDPREDDVFRDADLAAPGLPPLRADFVDRATARVVADLARIRAEADAVDDVTLPRPLLDEYAPPAPSSDFVARTAAAIAADRGRSEDAELRELLERYTPPKISAGFVARTLDALRDAPASLRLVRDVSAPRRPRLRQALVAAAALVIVVLGVRAFGRGDSASSQPSPQTIVASALSFSPSSATTVFARLTAAPSRGATDDDLDLVPLDGLLLLAQGATATRR